MDENTNCENTNCMKNAENEIYIAKHKSKKYEYITQKAKFTFLLITQNQVFKSMG